MEETKFGTTGAPFPKKYRPIIAGAPIPKENVIGALIPENGFISDKH